MDTAAGTIDIPPDDEPVQPLDPERCHRALRGRDARFDGRFFVGVRTTGIFCRPICPAPTPRPGNCSYWPSAAAAQAAGFRPCLRCRPEAAPGTPAWQGTGATVSRALRLIEAGALDGPEGVDALAARLGIGARHLRRLFERHLGTTPRAVAKLRRVLFAKQLLDETRLPLSQVAASAGFSSPRRFHACMREVYGRPPSALRRAAPKGRREPAGETARTITARPAPCVEAAPIVLFLPYRPPFAWSALLDFLRVRAIPGVECVGEADYRRTVALGAVRGAVRVSDDPSGSRLRVEASLSSTAGLIGLCARLRALFDLGADAEAIDEVLARVPRLRRSVARWPGLRVPGAFDGFETAVRAILGQQVSVAGATTLSGRVVSRWGGDSPGEVSFADGEAARVARCFPAPADLAEADLESIGIVRTRAEAIRSLARQLVAEPDWLDPGDGLAGAAARLESQKGIGPWTAQYVAMRVLREPDALPAGDLALRKALGRGGEAVPADRVEHVLARCRPYRAYGAMRLWHELSQGAVARSSAG